jgi:hypothetical protein
VQPGLVQLEQRRLGLLAMWQAQLAMRQARLDSPKTPGPVTLRAKLRPTPLKSTTNLPETFA